MSKVLWGVWKLVINASEILKSYLGKMNLLVHPLYGFNVSVVLTDVSMARMAVAPTETTRRPSALARLTRAVNLRDDELLPNPPCVWSGLPPQPDGMCPNRCEGSEGQVDALISGASAAALKVQAGGRNGDGTELVGVNRLETLAVFGFHFALEVLGDRVSTQLGDDLHEFFVRAVEQETQVRPRDVVLSMTSATNSSFSPK